MKRIISLACVVLLSVLCSMNVMASDTDCVIGSDGEKLAIPKTYLVEDVITYLGEDGGNLYEPSDIFIDKFDNIYIADKGNNRVVKLNSKGEYETSYYGENSLNAPQGIFYSDFGGLLVADTGNQRIVSLDSNDKIVETFTKPESDILEESSDFAITKVCVSKQGFLYVIKGQQFMMIDANNEFKGFVGANTLDFSLMRTLIRMFATEEQKSHMEMEDAPPFNNFVIADNGMIYAVAATDSAKIKKINANGDNLFPTDYVAEQIVDEDGYQIKADYVDIALDSYEVISVLERNTGHIYQYDQEGNLLTIFGGKGDKKGYFQNPCSIAVNSAGNVYVLDSSTGYIHIFKATSFMYNIKEAISNYANGEYETAYDKWQEVLETDVNYPLANVSIGKILYKMDEPEKAMEYFEIAKTQQHYGKAFAEYRYAFIKAHFFEVAVGVIAIVAIASILFSFVHRKANQFVHDYHFGPSEERRKKK